MSGGVTTVKRVITSLAPLQPATPIANPTTLHALEFPLPQGGSLVCLTPKESIPAYENLYEKYGITCTTNTTVGYCGDDSIYRFPEYAARSDPANADTYKANGESYNAQIDQAKTDAQTKFDTIPKERRVLVTGHDAFNYLGKTYDIEIRATDFVSSESEISASEIDELAAFIAEKKVPTIFQDNLKNPEAINHLKEAVVAKGWNVEVSDKPLYADSLGEQAPVDTYLGVFAYNAETIVAALAAK